MIWHEPGELGAKPTNPTRSVIRNIESARSGWPAPPSSARGVIRLQRLIGNRSISMLVGGPGRAEYLTTGGAQPTIQREVNKKGEFKDVADTVDGNVVVNPNAAINVVSGSQTTSHPAWFLTEATAPIEVEPGSTGSINLRIPQYLHYHRVDTVPDWGGLSSRQQHINVYRGPIDWWVDAVFTVGQDGKITILDPAPGGNMGVPGYLDATAAIIRTPPDSNGFGQLMVNVTFKAASSVATTTTIGKTTQTGGGVSVTVPPFGGSTTVNTSSAVSFALGVTTSGAATVMCSFGVHLKAKPSERIVKTKEVAYEHEGQVISGDRGIELVNEWWREIPGSIQSLIIAGKKHVEIKGGASKTGTATRNENVIAARKEDVRKRLQAISRSMVVDDSTEFTDADRRRVILKVEYTSSEEKLAGEASKP
jgi:hypothetical protein